MKMLLSVIYVQFNNIFKNNYRNIPMGSICTNTSQNNVFVNGNNWNATAQNIINGAGLEPAYSDIQFSGTIPGKIEAENYVAMYCVQQEPTTDIGSGEDAAPMAQGAWMDYFVNVTSSGNYKVNFRVASAISGAQFELRNGSFVLASVNVPNTGGWQTWQTVSANVALSAGQQTLRIYSTQTSNWNINWFDAQIVTSVQSVIGNQLSVKVFPNPFNSSATIFSEIKNCSIKIFDVMGNAIRSFSNVNQFPFTIDRENLSSGIYFLELRSENKVERMKLVIN